MRKFARPTLLLKAFNSDAATLAGIEASNMIRKTALSIPVSAFKQVASRAGLTRQIHRLNQNPKNIAPVLLANVQIYQS